MTTRLCSLLPTLAGLWSLILIASTLQASPVHGVAMHGNPAYPPDFTHFKYANPVAPKGGALKLAAISSSGFDTFNPFIPKGIPAAGINYLYDTLVENAEDEPFTVYGRLAESIEMPEDRSHVIFNLRPEARFHDGHPVTADDVVFTFNTLMEKGSPFYRFYYGDVKKVTALSSHQVRFDFAEGTNRELALIIGQIPILPEHFWKSHDFSKADLTQPLGSGPYRIRSFEPGRSITYERVKDYWGADIPVNKGKYNFDTITIDYYRDNTVALEAFKAGQYDFRQENTARLWATAYTGSAFDNKQIIKVEIPHQLPSGMQGYVFNQRNPLFQDIRVRKAIIWAFDFEWTNKQFMHDAYTRTLSYFDNSELAAKGLPSEAELKILSPYRDQLPEEVFTREFKLPVTDGSGNNRAQLRQAMAWLKEAGWTIQDRHLQKDGQIFSFEILINSPAFEPHTLAFINNLKRLGMDVSMRTLADRQQYVHRMRHFDFDMAIGSYGQSNSPGNEQRDMWSSEAADKPDSRNLMGLKNPVVDQLIEGIIAAKDRQELVNYTRALDRVLQWGFYLVPHWHYRYHRIAYWHHLNHPDITPPYGLGLDTWWYQADKK